MDDKNILEAVNKALESGERKFTQSIDLIITLKRVDMKKNPVKINDNVVLPKGSGKDAYVVAVVDGEASTQAKGIADLVITSKTLSDYDQKASKKVSQTADFFSVQAPLMQKFAQVFGRSAGSRGKMPLPKDVLAPNADPTSTLKRLKNSVRIRVRNQPVVTARVGTEKMEPRDLVDNIKFVYDMVLHQVPLDNIGKIYVKTTMGKAVKVE